MFIDASALAAMVTDEHDAAELFARVNTATARMTSPMALWEATVAVARIMNFSVPRARRAVEDVLSLARISVEAVPPEVGDLALDAFDRFGKGRHPAALNFGDCFAYACARHFRQPLLYKGADFARTDIEPA